MDLTILQNLYPYLSEIDFQETLNINYNDKLKQSNIINKEEKNQLKTICKTLNNNTRICKYEYKTIKYGRLYDKNNTGSLNMSQKLRGILYSDYVEIDIENCQPTILYEICKNNNIQCDKLSYYVKNRNEIIIKYNISKDEIKKIFSSVMNSNKQIETHNLELNEYLFEFKTEIIKITNIIIENNMIMYEHILEIKKNKEHPNGIFLSYYLQEKERNILEIMVKYMLNNYPLNNNVSLCADGFMILKENYNINLESELEIEIKNKTGYELKIKKKEMNQSYLEILM